MLIGVVLLTIVQTMVVGRFTMLLRRDFVKPTDSTPLPRVGIVLPVRGLDPFLEETLQALAKLDYADFEVHLIVDDESDAAWPVVNLLVDPERDSRFYLHLLTEKLPTCGLKNSALLQAWRTVPTSCDILAVIDSDVVPQPDWLLRLVQPLVDDETVAVTSGLRWYSPPSASDGALLRGIWNVSATPQTWVGGVVWGGSMAIRRSAMNREALETTWARTLTDDCILVELARQAGSRTVVNPHLIVANSERIDVRSLKSWLSRQLLSLRLTHSAWPLAVIRGASAVLFLLTCAGIALVAMATGQWHALGLIGLTQVIFWGAGVCLLKGIDRAVTDRLARDGVQARRVTDCRWWQLATGIVRTRVLYLGALYRAAVATRVDWRGIQYDIGPDKQVQMTHYAPLETTAAHDREMSVV